MTSTDSPWWGDDPFAGIPGADGADDYQPAPAPERDPALMSQTDALAHGQAVPGGPGACADCHHAKVWHSVTNRRHPCERCGCQRYAEQAAKPADDFRDCPAGDGRIYLAANGGWYHWADGRPVPACPRAAGSAARIAELVPDDDALSVDEMAARRDDEMFGPQDADLAAEPGHTAECPGLHQPGEFVCPVIPPCCGRDGYQAHFVGNDSEDGSLFTCAGCGRTFAIDRPRLVDVSMALAEVTARSLELILGGRK